MILTSHLLDDILRLLDENSGKPREFSCSGLTLDALLELACCRWQWQKSNNEEGLDFWSRVESQMPLLSQSWKALQGQQSLHSYNSPLLNVVPNLELRSVQSRSDILNWNLFSDRFGRALERNGFGDLSLGVVGAFKEMADNIVQHSGPDAESPACGIAAYAVDKGSMCYAVVDVGRGVLNSLRDNPQHKGIFNSQMALHQAIENQASRRNRASEDPPKGFKSLLESLGTLNADLRFRSGDGLLIHQGPTLSRQHSDRLVPYRQGFQLSVTCHLHASAPAFTIEKFS